MTNTQSPAEEQGKPPIVDEWADDFDKKDITIRYKHEEQAEKTEDKTEEEEKDDVPPAPDAAPVVSLEDPGDFTPEDYSFEYDIDGKKYKISTAEDVDNIPDDDLEKLKASQLTQLIRKANAIDSKTDNDKRLFDEKKSKYDEQVVQSEQQRQTIESYAAEFDYLVSKGFIPKVAEKLKDADWTDAAVSSQEGVKEQKEILEYIIKENKQRAKLNLKPLDSIIDAYNSMQMEKSRSKDKEDDKASKQARKDAGARVSGPSNNPAATVAPRGIAVGRTNVFRNSSVWE